MTTKKKKSTNWIWNNQEVHDISFIEERVVGFIYLITLSNNMKYIGKKNFFSKRKRNFGKKEISKMSDKRLKTYEYVIKESDWKSYTGSSELMKVIPKNITIVKKEIIDLARSNKELTYLELHHQVVNDVLRNDNYYNSNILGKFFRNDFI